MSFNKSQGQEMDSVLLDLRNSVFTHGHLYVALSRVRDASKDLDSLMNNISLDYVQEQDENIFFI